MKKIIVLLLALVMCLSVLTACGGGNGDETGDGDVVYNLENAAKYVKNTHNKMGVDTPSDYEVDSVCSVAGVTYTVTWSIEGTDKVTVEQGEGATKTVINVDEKTDVDIEYTLKATITAGDGTTTTVSFSHKVPKYELLTYDEYMAAEKGDTVVIEGIVVAINSKSTGSKRNHLFLADASGKGGYYSYQMDKDPAKDLGIKLGMTVSVAGPVEPYGGMQEIKGGVATIINKEVTEYKPVDITDVIKNGGALTDYVALPVTIKGVTVGTQELDVETSQYLNFSLGEFSSYIRTYLTDLPDSLGADVDAKGAAKKTIDEAHAAKLDWTANVTGILIFYNPTTPYLIPTSAQCFEYLEYVEKTPEDKIKTELDAIKIDSSYSSDTEIAISATGKYYKNDVTLTWTSDNAAIKVEADKLVITIPEDATTVKLTVTAKCGDKTESKDFEVKLSKSVTSVKEANEIGSKMESNTYTDSKYIISGIIVELNNEEYGNCYIMDESGEKIYVYGLVDANNTKYNALTEKPKQGDYVVVSSTIGNYKGTPQLKNAVIVSFTSAISIPKANEIGVAETPDTNKYYVAGIVTEIYNTQYGNFYLTDGENTITVYGSYDQAGNRFDAMPNQFKVGDAVAVYGVISQYGGKAQFKDATIVCIDTSVQEDDEKPEGGNTEGGTTEGGNTGATGTTVNYEFSAITGSVQYAPDEKHTMTEDLTVTVNDGHINTQLRLYDSSSHDSTAIIESKKAVKSLVINAGNKAATLKVYGSVDGVTYTLIEDVAVVAAYTDYTVNLGDAGYKFIKLDADGDQIRVAKITFTFAE